MRTNFEYIRAYIEGDNHALQMLFFKRGYDGLVYAKAYRTVWRPDKESKARTVVHDVFLSLFDKSSKERKDNFQGKSERDFVNYIFSIANNKAVDINRREKNIELLGVAIPEGHEPPPDMNEPDETEIKLKKVRECAVKSLSAPDGEFYELWLWEGHTEQKLMVHYRWSKEEVHTAKVRIMRRLRKCLGIGL